MATKKITQGTIKRMIKEGSAVDILKMKKQPSSADLDTIAISYGVNGMNGGLFINRKTKRMYAIDCRCSELFYYA